jgi:hypothetical protein
MATTSTPSDLQEIRYRREYWREYVRESGYAAYMGNDAMKPIHTCYEMTSGGKSLTIPLVGRLANAGVEGNTRLSGSEESLGKHTHAVTVQFSRHAVELSKQDEHYDASNAREAVRPLLKEWSMNRLRDRIIDSMGSVAFSGAASSTFWTPLDSGRNSAAGTTALNTWRAANTDRALFGAAIANNATDFATSIATLNSPDDKLTASMVSVAKRLAKTADPHIRPIRSSAEDGREYFVMFCNPMCFRDLKNDSTIIANNRDARSREGNGMDKNPLFQDGDLIHDGVICREIPEIPSFSNGSIQVSGNFLCGAQAVAIAWGQEPRFTAKKEDDYDFFSGIGIEELVGCNKIMRKHGVAGTFKDHGMVTVFATAVGDA